MKIILKAALILTAVLSIAACSKKSGSQEAVLSHAATIKDTVSYRGLTPGKTYTLCGTLVLKPYGEVLIQNDIPIKGMTEFVPDAPDGEAEVTFVLDTEMIQGRDIVVFEQLYAGSLINGTPESDVPVAVHEDIEDEGQTITVPVRPPHIVRTGDDRPVGLMTGALIMSSLGLYVAAKTRRKKS